MLVYRRDPPLPEIFRPSHQTPSAHRPAVVSHADTADLEALSDIDSDDEDAALADDVKGKSVVGDSFDCEGSPEGEATSSCPKKPRTTVRKQRASLDIR